MGVSNARIFNNTFVNVNDSNPSDAASILPIGNLTNVLVYNNMFYNTNPRIINGSHNYNWFDSDSHGEANAQVSTSSPFVSYSGKDYRLSGPTMTVVSQPSPYNLDMLGNTRGADGVWDRGAYEFGGTSTVKPIPAVPTGLTVN